MQSERGGLVLLVMGLMFLFVGTLCTVGVWIQYMEDKRIQAGGQRVEGYVKKKSFYAADGTSEYKVQFWFRTHSGQLVEAIREIPTELWTTLNEGQSIEVFYLEKNPKRNFPVGGHATSLKAPIFFSAMAAPFVTIGLVLVAAMFFGADDADEFNESYEALEFYNPRVLPLRIIAIALSLPFLVVDAFIIQDLWNMLIGRGAPLSGNLAVFSACFTIASLGMCLALLWWAIMRPGNSMVFDRKNRTVTVISLALIPWRREWQFSFGDVSNIEVVESEAEDAESAARYELRLSLCGNKEFRAGRFKASDPVFSGLDRIRRFVGLVS
jgi:hypothetical protein